MPPQGQQPGGGKRGPGAGIIITISVLVLALIGVLVWILFFKGDDGTTAEPKPSTSSSSVQTPQETEKPGGEDTPGGDEPGSNEPGGDQTGGQQPGGSDPGSQQPEPKPGDAGKLTADDLPKQIGEWQLSEFGLTMYTKGETGSATIAVLDFGEEDKIMEYAHQNMQNVDEFDGGFCGTVDSGAEKLEVCYIHPGKKPNSVASVSGSEVSRADLVEVAKGIAAYK